MRQRVRIGLQREEFRANGNAGDLSLAEPAHRGVEIDGSRLHPAADEAIGEAGDGVGFKCDGGNAELKGSGHGGARCIAADAEDNVGLELLDQTAAVGEVPRQVHHGAQFGFERNAVERADVDEAKVETGVGDEAHFHAAWRADEENLRPMVFHQIVGHGKRRNDVPTGATARNQYS